MMDVYGQINDWLDQIETWQDGPTLDEEDHEACISLLNRLQSDMKQILRVQHEFRVLGREQS